MFKIIKKLFCKHTFESVEWWEDITDNVRHSTHKIRCNKCNKERVVHGSYWHNIQNRR